MIVCKENVESFIQILVEIMPTRMWLCSSYLPRKRQKTITCLLYVRVIIFALLLVTSFINTKVKTTIICRKKIDKYNIKLKNYLHSPYSFSMLLKLTNWRSFVNLLLYLKFEKPIASVKSPKICIKAFKTYLLVLGFRCGVALISLLASHIFIFDLILLQSCSIINRTWFIVYLGQSPVSTCSKNAIKPPSTCRLNVHKESSKHRKLVDIHSVNHYEGQGPTIVES